MSQPNYFLIQRKALARFRNKIPFLALIPPAIYQRLSPAEWYEPFGEIAQVRAELEEELNCYVMTSKRFGPLIPWETQLVVYITEAHLAQEERAILALQEVNDAARRLGLKFEAFQKPLQDQRAHLSRKL